MFDEIKDENGNVKDYNVALQDLAVQFDLCSKNFLRKATIKKRKVNAKSNMEMNQPLMYKSTSSVVKSSKTIKVM